MTRKAVVFGSSSGAHTLYSRGGRAAAVTRMNVERTEARTAAPDFLSRRAGALCVALLALMAAQMLGVIRQKSITVDEWVLIPAGFYHLTEGDYRPVSEHPPVAKVLAAVPLLFTETAAPRVDGGPGDYERFL